MTAPDNDFAFYDHNREAAPRCSVPGCAHPSYAVSLFAGRRCQCHAAVYDAGVTSALRATGWPDTASAYRHTYGEL